MCVRSHAYFPCPYPRPTTPPESVSEGRAQSGQRPDGLALPPRPRPSRTARELSISTLGGLPRGSPRATSLCPFASLSCFRPYCPISVIFMTSHREWPATTRAHTRDPPSSIFVSLRLAPATCDRWCRVFSIAQSPQCRARQAAGGSERAQGDVL